MGELQRAAGATERLIEILQVESDIKAPSNYLPVRPDMPAEVNFNSVSFNYPSRPNQPAIKELNLTAEQAYRYFLITTMRHLGAQMRVLI